MRGLVLSGDRARFRVNREFIQKTVDSNATKELNFQAGSAYRGLGQMDCARAEYARVISVIEDIRLHVAGSESEQAVFFANRLEFYHRMMELLVTEENNAEAFEYAERAGLQKRKPFEWRRSAFGGARLTNIHSTGPRSFC